MYIYIHARMCVPFEQLSCEVLTHAAQVLLNDGELPPASWGHCADCAGDTPLSLFAKGGLATWIVPTSSPPNKKGTLKKDATIEGLAKF